MQLTTLKGFAASALVILAPVADASALHGNMHHQARRYTHLHHEHHHRAVESPPSSASSLVKRGTCEFPTDDPNLVAVTPDKANAGWAMSPDQPCKPGSYCPFACKEGLVMNQWQPDSTYDFPQSMNGGLLCGDDGVVKKPFPDRPNCVPGTGAVKAVNKCSAKLSYCQTVLPGNEAMLIPTLVQSTSNLAVPDQTYWAKTAAHYYINPPGVGVEGCIWGTESKAVGNWAAFVAGANTVDNGETYVKIGVNPVWESSDLSHTKPNYGLKIECPDGDCNGLPCEISPDAEVKSNNLGVGAGGAKFCVVTVAKGKHAQIVAFDRSGGQSSAPVGNAMSGQDSSSSSSPPPQSSPKSSSTPPPPSTTSTPSPTPSPTPSSSSTSTSTSTDSPIPSSSQVTTTTTTTTVSTPSSTTSETPTVQPGIFHEEKNNTATHTPNSTYAASPTSPQTTPTTKDQKNEAGRSQGRTTMGSLIVALVAAACFF